jgi:hypothetical protein
LNGHSIAELSRRASAQVNHADEKARRRDLGGAKKNFRPAASPVLLCDGLRDDSLLKNHQPVSDGGFPRRETVSCVLLTDRLTAEAAGWFSAVREIVDELVIFVDTALAGEETHALARQLTGQVHELKGQGHVEAHLEQMVGACSGEWVLRLDSDEQLTPGWMAGIWRELLRGETTHFICPRRWIHPAGGFIDSAPWWPDWQMRLFRNEPGRLTFPQKIHEPTIVTGPGQHLFHLGIDHHVLRLNTRAQREEKVRHYAQLRPEKPLGHYYLFEDVAPASVPLLDLAGRECETKPAELVA